MAKTVKPSIKGKRVLVTGGARGMGLLWAKLFARDGAQVALWDLSSKVMAAADEIRELGRESFAQIVDVTNRVDVETAAKELEEKFGPIDILVNNAGIVVGGPFMEVDQDSMARVLDVNLKSLIFTTRAFLSGMIERGHGHVMNVGSASGFIGVPYMATYTASKWGIIGFTDSLRLELQHLGHDNIGISVFCPSYVDTGLFAGAKAPIFTPLMTPEQAVERGYKAFRKGVYVIKEPFMVKVTPALRTLLPQSVFDSIANVLGATSSMSDWKGRPKD